MKKSSLAAQALLSAHPVENRSHAYKVLAAAGLNGSGSVFNAAVRAYEEKHGPLGKSSAAKRKENDAQLRAKAHQMSADEVLAHINEISSADPLFWACWKVWKWNKQIPISAFAQHFKREAA